MKITPDISKDQHFLVNEDIIRKIAGLADLNKDDVVLEVGAGTGNLTRELAKKAGQVIAFEIDERYASVLSDLPGNVELRLKDAWNFVKLRGKWKKKKRYNKIVSNLPYSFAEKFLHNLTFVDYDKAILLVPQSFSKKIKTHPVFGSFFQVEEKFKVDKEEFDPVPKTDSVVINLIRLPDPRKTKDLVLFLRQFIYQYEEVKTKNSLREGLIKYHWMVNKKRLTKKQSKELISRSGIDPKLLERVPNNPDIYQQITERFIKVEI